MSIVEFLKAKKPEAFSSGGTLYHYTSFEMLEKFLRDDADFYCTHFRMLNDSAELTKGVSVVIKHLQRFFHWSEWHGLWFWKNFNQLILECEIVVPWIMSFSRERDSLNQWGMYTDSIKGGVAIGFKRDSLWRAIVRSPGCFSKEKRLEHEKNGVKVIERGSEAAFELRLLPCLYSVTDKRIISELIEKRVEEHAEVFERIGSRNLKDIEPKDFTLAVYSMLEVSAIIKHEAFVNEEEERLIVMPMTHNYFDCEVLGGKFRWKTYVADVLKEGKSICNQRHRFLRGMMNEILVSPHGDQPMLLMMARLLLEKYGMKNYCDLKPSQLPYNAQ